MRIRTSGTPIGSIWGNFVLCARFFLAIAKMSSDVNAADGRAIVCVVCSRLCLTDRTGLYAKWLDSRKSQKKPTANNEKHPIQRRYHIVPVAYIPAKQTKRHGEAGEGRERSSLYNACDTFYACVFSPHSSLWKFSRDAHVFRTLIIVNSSSSNNNNGQDLMHIWNKST